MSFEQLNKWLSCILNTSTSRLKPLPIKWNTICFRSSSTPSNYRHPRVDLNSKWMTENPSNSKFTWCWHWVRTWQLESLMKIILVRRTHDDVDDESRLSWKEYGFQKECRKISHPIISFRSKFHAYDIPICHHNILIIPSIDESRRLDSKGTNTTKTKVYTPSCILSLDTTYSKIKIRLDIANKTSGENRLDQIETGLTLFRRRKRNHSIDVCDWKGKALSRVFILDKDLDSRKEEEK
jgi:hypothetical protein